MMNLRPLTRDELIISLNVRIQKLQRRKKGVERSIEFLKRERDKLIRERDRSDARVLRRDLRQGG